MTSSQTSTFQILPKNIPEATLAAGWSCWRSGWRPGTAIGPVRCCAFEPRTPAQTSASPSTCRCGGPLRQKRRAVRGGCFATPSGGSFTKSWDQASTASKCFQHFLWTGVNGKLLMSNSRMKERWFQICAIRALGISLTKQQKLT